MTKAVIEITAAILFSYLLVAFLIYECRDCSSNCGESLCCYTLKCNGDYLGRHRGNHLARRTPQPILPQLFLNSLDKVGLRCYLSRGGASFQSLHHRTREFHLALGESSGVVAQLGSSQANSFFLS
jgi:hypothetical protein